MRSSTCNELTHVGFLPIVTNRISGKSQAEIKKLLLLKPKDRGSVTKIANRLGAPGSGPHEWLVLTPKDKMPLPAVVSFPKPPKAADGSLVYDRVPNKSPDVVAVPAEKELTIIPTQATSTIRKRAHEEQQLNGTEGGCCFTYGYFQGNADEHSVLVSLKFKVEVMIYHTLSLMK